MVVDRYTMAELEMVGALAGSMLFWILTVKLQWNRFLGLHPWSPRGPGCGSYLSNDEGLTFSIELYELQF